MTLTAVSILIGIIGPVYTYFHNRILYTLTGVSIPFVEPKSSRETALNCIYQGITLYNAFFGMIVVSVLENFFGDGPLVGAGVSALELEALSDALQRNLYKKTQMFGKLNKIIQQVQVIDE